MSWNGPKEKKWEWYKHTKPCYNIIYLKSCDNTNCNYAHSIDQYIDAILKRNFKIDAQIVDQLKKVDTGQIDVDMNQSPPEVNEPSAKRRRVE
jgi:hypothetical protein